MGGWRKLNSLIPFGKAICFLGVLALVLRLAAVIISRGYYYPDEFYAYIEQPFYWAFPNRRFTFDFNGEMEFRTLYIHWVHFGLISIVKNLDFYSPSNAYIFMRSMMAIASMSTVFFVYLGVKKLLNERLAGVAATTYGLWYYNIYFSTRLLSENYAVLFLAAATYCLVLVEKRSANTKVAFWADPLLYFGFFVALATAMRIQMAIFCLGPALVFVCRKGWRNLGILSLSFWAIYGTIGVSEFFTRGQLFSTLLNYYEINITKNFMFQGSVSPWYEYLASWNLQFSEVLFPFIFLFVLVGALKFRVLGSAFIVFFIFHSYFPHKEVRFLYPSLPCVWVLGIVGMEKTVTYLNAIKKFSTNKLNCFMTFLYLFAQIYGFVRIDWDGGISGDMFRLLEQVGTLDDSKKVILIDEGQHLGYFTLNKDIYLKGYARHEVSLSELSGQDGVYVIIPKDRLLQFENNFNGLTMIDSNKRAVLLRSSGG